MNIKDLKAKLYEYKALLVEVELAERRLTYLPDDEIENNTLKARNVETALRTACDKERLLYNAINKLVDQLKVSAPQQATIILMRYVDGQDWDVITSVVYGNAPDFYEHAESYKRRAYREHGRALAQLVYIEKNIKELEKCN